ncbi:MAG: hypothetical protein Q9M11_03390, partial [Mariprofundaceae bacterium]|nr:hypothetical protein [Mariprofundaceae bacterium]
TNTVDTVHNSTATITNNTTDEVTEASASITNNTDVSTNTSKTSITNNTAAKTDNVSAHYQVNLKSYAVDNGADELITVISDFIQAVSDGMGIGNVGAPVPFDAGTISSLAAIKARIDGFK